jgi:hypothetical protein
MPLRAKITTTDQMASLDSSLKGQLEKAVEEGKIPQGVVFAATGDGTWLIAGCWNSRRIGHGSMLLTWYLE